MEAASDVLKLIINKICEPGPFFALMVLWCFGSVIWADKWVKPKIAFSMMGGFFLLYLFAITDKNFQTIAFKGDNIPIIAMLFMSVYFTWLGFWRGVENDKRKAEGRPMIEEEGKEVKVLVWPHLIYIEFIVGIFSTALLVVWSIVIFAPLEEPASSAATPNPSKAPWYFLGLQEMLVYFDPWMAGVVAPSLIVVGLMAIPYLDKNPKGNGYYTIKERWFAISFFNFGYLVLWMALIFLGTVMRGPNWNFFGPFDYWDVHKQPVLNNLNLSELFFIKTLDMGLPEHWLKREALGIILTVIYLFVLPVAFAKVPFFQIGKFFTKLKLEMGATRYYTFMFLFLTMMSLPIKMVLRWTVNLKYIVAIPEYFFNI